MVYLRRVFQRRKRAFFVIQPVPRQFSNLSSLIVWYGLLAEYLDQCRNASRRNIPQLDEFVFVIVVADSCGYGDGHLRLCGSSRYPVCRFDDHRLALLSPVLQFIHQPSRPDVSLRHSRSDGLF